MKLYRYTYMVVFSAGLVFASEPSEGIKPDTLQVNPTTQAKLDKLLDVNQELQRANKLAVSNYLQDALEITKKLNQQYPDNKDVHKTYAKFLFWNGNINEAYNHIVASGDTESKLYHQIYTSKMIYNIKKIKSSKKRLEYIATLDKSLQNNYDIMWLVMNAYIKQHKYVSAFNQAKKISNLYPKSQEAKEAMARLLYWRKHYYESLNLYKKLEKEYGVSYKKEIKKLRRAIYYRDKQRNTKNSTVKEQKKVKKTEVNSVFSENENLRYRMTNLLITNHNYKHMVGVGYDYFKYSIDRDTDNTKYIEATLPIYGWTLYNRVENTHRYGLEDTRYYAELYPTMPKPWWGYLSFSFTPSADFYAKYSIGWHQYYDIGNWEFGLGYNYAKYSSLSTNTLIANYTYYFNDNLFFTQTYYYVTDNESWSLSNKLEYRNSKMNKYYISYIKSDAYEENDEIGIKSSTNIKSDKFALGGEIPFATHYSFGFDVSYEKFDTKYVDYNKKELNMYLRYYW